MELGNLLIPRLLAGFEDRSGALVFTALSPPPLFIIGWKLTLLITGLTPLLDGAARACTQDAGRRIWLHHQLRERWFFFMAAAFHRDAGCCHELARVRQPSDGRGYLCGLSGVVPDDKAPHGSPTNVIRKTADGEEHHYFGNGSTTRGSGSAAENVSWINWGKVPRPL